MHLGLGAVNARCRRLYQAVGEAALFAPRTPCAVEAVLAEVGSRLIASASAAVLGLFRDLCPCARLVRSVAILLNTVDDVAHEHYR